MSWLDVPLTTREKALLVGSPAIGGLLLALVCWGVSEWRYWRTFRVTED